MRKKVKTPPLSPGRKLFLLVWTTIVVCFAFVIFAKASFQIRIAGVILAGVIGGILVGLKMLRKVDELLVAFGLATPHGQGQDSSGAARPGLENVVAFLRTHRKKGQFTRQDFSHFCHEAKYQAEPLLKVILDKGWVVERQSSFLITSKGEDLMDQAM